MPHGGARLKSEPLPETAARLGELGVGSVVFDPAGNRRDKGDYLAVMNENVRSLESPFTGAPGG